MDKQSLLAKIKLLDGLTPEERAELVNLLNAKKKYGLIWEDKPEDVEEQLRTKLPVLREVIEKRILATKSASETATPKAIKTNLFTKEENQSSDNGLLNEVEAPNHILIEGDNLHALTALTFTHENKIDVIYIDPPYNTGNKDFKYNDAFVDKEDSYRHSKWLSFMHKRLEIAKRLLSDKGVIFISIDDNEQAQLKLLCDEIFETSNDPSKSNILATLVWDLGTGTQAGHFTRSHEYILAYSKDKSSLDNFSGGSGIIDHSALKKISVKNPSSNFRFNKGVRFDAEDNFELTDTWGGSEKTTLIEGRMVAFEGKLKYDVVLSAGWAQKNQMKTWFSGQETIDSKGQKVVEFYFNKSGVLKYKKDRGIINPKTVLSELGSTKTGSTLLTEIVGDNPFDYPKSLDLIKFILGLLPSNSKILDFFAGSGTTLQATMQLNAEYGGSRQCILVTNNENNICEEVTYERNKGVIQGYTNAKGVQVEGLTNNNMRYYRSEYVGRDHTHKNKKELVLAATELLCIKEDIYTELAELNGQKLNSKVVRCFSDKGKYMLVIYDEEAIETLLPLINNVNSHKKIKIYIFAPGQYPFTEEFEDVLNKVELCALPDAIYKAYANVLPKKKAKSNVDKELE